jgi:undecaprenyl-diphosphatase
MEYLQAIVLGLVQGVTEFLPISSSAHLIIFRDIFGWDEVLCGRNAAAACIPRAGWSKTALDGFELGSLIALFIYFWHDIVSIFVGAGQAYQTENWQKKEWKILWGIAIGSCPALAAGLGFKMSGVTLDSPVLIGVMSIVMAMLLGLAEQFGKRVRSFSKLKVSDGILVGLAQILALLPGASRSGSTITAALFLGMRRHTAARFSFLLGIPTMTLTSLAQAKDVLQERTMILPLLVGILATVFFSYFSIDWLMKFLQKQSSWIFVWYRLAFGLSILSAYVIYGKLPSLVQQ